jgi:oligopeptide/dipeptide ABC transporter ATP-binding protein
MGQSSPLLEITALRKHFPSERAGLFVSRTAYLKAVDGVNLAIRKGETLALIGESGCGKSTIFRTALRLETPTSGSIALHGENVHQLKGKELKKYRKAVQAVFQDPWSSLNPRMTVGDNVAEALVVNHRLGRAEVASRVGILLERVGLHWDQAKSYPHEFSGGQRQRIALAAALVSEPDLVLLDEPVSALDVSVRAQIMNLLSDIQKQTGVAYFLIAHNLSTVRFLAHRTAVMYLGKIVEQGETRELFDSPLHPYTKALLVAASPAKPGSSDFSGVLKGEIPSPFDPPSGCSFHTRCPAALSDPALMSKCRSIEPKLIEKSLGRKVACHLYSAQAPEYEATTCKPQDGRSVE